MASLMNRIRAFGRSPEGRRLVAQGKRMASDPRTRSEAKRLFGRLRKRPPN
ncbi:hypothetical protein [Streptomyces ureilyticus]|jgi:hypothetical protein|uniref:Uncharacterized protein n=1 Tax=Streptomyces ureilyticus TaxID=1775131 RepID=A0ABX0DVB2_9ACTN|nr:hypothetical protein [Streptomyces ureilyticus]NGO45868.1 hypothetical protein [Streptomyces ureilyticus]